MNQGYTAKFPDGQWLTNLRNKLVTTVIKFYFYQVGRTGSITQLQFAPVPCWNYYKRASLHNADQIEKLDIM
jgi:DNA ligase (NAD+)